MIARLKSTKPNAEHLVYFLPDVFPCFNRYGFATELARHYDLTLIFYRGLTEQEIARSVQDLINGDRPVDVVLTDTNGQKVRTEHLAALRDAFGCKMAKYWVDIRDGVPALIRERAHLLDLLLWTNMCPDRKSEIEAMGTRVLFLWPESNPSFYFPIPATTKRYDVAFAGNNAREHFPHAAARNEIIKQVNDKYRLNLMGKNWDEIKPGCRFLVDKRDTNTEYQKARCALSISQFRDVYGYSSDRLGNCILSGVPTVMQTFPGWQELVDPDWIWTFDEDPSEAIDEILADEQAANERAIQAREAFYARYNRGIWADTIYREVTACPRRS